MNFSGIEGTILFILTLGLLGLFIYFASGLFGPRMKDEVPEHEPDSTDFQGEDDDTCHHEASASC
jgi:hypothetical protein